MRADRQGPGRRRPAGRLRRLPRQRRAAQRADRGAVAAGVGGVAQFAPQIRAGRIRALAVASPQRLPDVDAPTLLESGVRHVHADRAHLLGICREVSASAEWSATCRRRWTPIYLDGPDFHDWFAVESARSRDVLTDLGVRRSVARPCQGGLRMLRE
ncbi:hypothetical protein [Herbidospora sp. RD11066]